MGVTEFVNKTKYFYKSLLFWILVGIFLGITIGIVMISVGTYSSRVIMLIKFPGDIFLRMLNCVAVPLLSVCLASAIGNLDKSISFRIGLQFLLCSFIMKIEASMLGYVGTFPFLSLRNLMTNKTKKTDKGKERRVPVDNYLDLFRNMFCRNIMEMFIYTYETILLPVIENNKTTDISNWLISGRMQTAPNVMGIVVISICVGIAMKSGGTSCESLVRVMASTTKLFFILMKWVIYTSPLLLIFLMAGSILAHENLLNMAQDAGLYFCAFMILYPIQFFIIYPLFFFLATRTNPFKLLSAKVIFTAFSTASSLGTMPLAIEYFEEVKGYDSRITRFVLSVGVNVSKDGATLFYSFASRLASFINVIDMGPYDTMRMLILAMAGSVGTPAVPFGAMGILWVIWSSMGFDDSADFYGTVFSLEWLRDRISTVVNLYGNCFILGVLYHYNKHIFEVLPEIEKSPEEKDVEQEGNQESVENQENVG